MFGKTDLSNAEYHARPEISKSGLDLLAKSPLHYWSAYLDPEREPRQENAAMALGTAVHTAVLEPEEFDKRYVVSPKFDRRTKEGKAGAEAFEATLAGRIGIDVDQHRKVMRIAQSARAHNMSKILLDDGLAETSLFWTDPDTGVECKCRPDFIKEIGGQASILDLKTTTDASPDGFCRSAWKWRYWVQAAFYRDGFAAATGLEPGLFAFLAVETESPFASAWYFADAEMLEAGRREYKKLLGIYAHCKENNTWPGYDKRMQPVSMPKWFQMEDDA